MGILDIAKQATNKITYKLNEATYDPKAEAAALSTSATNTPKSGNVNQNAFNTFKGEWGTKAVISGLIDPKFFKSYESILAIQPPPPNADQATFDKAINDLAAAIKAWYVGAKYKGDMKRLAFEIDQSKPKYVIPGGVKEVIKPVTPPTATQQFTSSFLKTLGITLLILVAVFVFILAGSLAANDAIGRSPGIRIVSFIYGFIPFFSPFVLIYYIYRYFKGNYPVFYNLLPVTTYQSPNWFISTLLWPFYYIEDANSEFQRNEYDRIGKTFVWLADPRSSEEEKAASEANDETKAILRAGLNAEQTKEALGAAGLNNGRMNNEVTVANVQMNNKGVNGQMNNEVVNGRMNNEVVVANVQKNNGAMAMNLVANAINNQPKPQSAPSNNE